MIISLLAVGATSCKGDREGECGCCLSQSCGAQPERTENLLQMPTQVQQTSNNPIGDDEAAAPVEAAAAAALSQPKVVAAPAVYGSLPEPSSSSAVSEPPPPDDVASHRRPSAACAIEVRRLSCVGCLLL
jgi:hypothetical protein